MNIIDNFSNAIIDRTYQLGFTESEFRKRNKEYTKWALALIGLGLLLAIFFGSIKIAVFWLFCAGVLLYGCFLLLAFIILAGLKSYILAIIFIMLYFSAGFYTISIIPADPFAMIFLFTGTSIISTVVLFNIELVVIKKHLKSGAVFPDLKRKQP